MRDVAVLVMVSCEMNRRGLLARASAAAMIGSAARAQPLPVLSDTVPPRTGAGPLWTGVPLGASLNLDFMSTPGTLDPRLTFTRGSTATYFDVTGTMQTVSGNTPRWDYDPVTHALRGLLIEEQRINLILNSGDVSNVASWGTSGGSGAVAPTVTGHQIAAPDSTVSGTKLAFPAVSGAGAFSNTYASAILTAAVYTYSVWLRGNVGGEQVWISITNGSTIYYSTVALLTTSWQRFVVTSPSLTATGWYFTIGVDLRDGVETSKPTQTIYAWGAQAELGAFPTSYIPTTAATVTRSVDSCTIPSASMGWFVSPGGSWQCEFIDLSSVAGNLRVLLIPPYGPGTFTPAFVDPGWHGGQYNGGAALNVANATAPGTVTKLATTASGTTQTVCMNGGAVVSGAIAGGYSGAVANGVAIMQSGSAVDSMTGYIRRVRYWPRVLSNTEMQQVTT